MGTWQPIRRFGKAIFSFEANGENQVSLEVGATVYADVELGGWYRGFAKYADRTISGIFPASYVAFDNGLSSEMSSPRDRSISVEVLSDPPYIEAVIVREKNWKQPKDKNTGKLNESYVVSNKELKLLPLLDRCEGEESEGEIKKLGSETRTPNAVEADDAMSDELSEQYVAQNRSETVSLIDEISMAIPDLEKQLKAMLVNGDAEGYHDMKQKIAQLLSMRRLVMDNNADTLVRQSTRTEIIGILESCRRSTEGHICPRTPNHSVASVFNTPIRQLIVLHQEMYKIVQQESSSLWQKKAVSRQGQMLGDVSKSRSISSSEKEFEFDDKIPRSFLSLRVDVKACIFSVGEPTRVHFSLFSVQRQQFISEEYVVELTAAGMPEDINLLGKLQAEFRELDISMFKDELYLVCYIFRIGQLKLSPKCTQKRNKVPQSYRRPFGCALMNVTAFSNLFESFGSWTSPPHLTIYRAKDPLQFTELYNLIIRGGSYIEVVPQTKGFALGLLLQEMSTKIDPASCVQMLQLSSFINPIENRNDFYVTLRGGDFLQDKKKSSKNIEIRMRVFTAAGFLVPDCIFRGVGPTVIASTEYCSTVHYHWNNPVYHETIKFQIPKQIFSQCHILFTVWHVSSNPEKNQLCSFTFMPLACSNGAVIADGLHVLPCYKPIKNLGQQNATLRYLGANAHFRDGPKQFGQPILIKRKEEIFLETLLSSVKTTQLATLHALFNWRQLDVVQLKSTVAKFTTISGTELSKFVKEVFDTLFSILRLYPNHHEEISNSVFVGILHCIDQLTTKMCSVSGSIDAYIADVYAFPDVYMPLVSHSRAAFLYGAQHLATPDPFMFKQLTLLSKCFQYVVKFIVRSAQCSRLADSDLFREQLKGFLGDMLMLLTIQGGSNDLLIGCKAFLLQSFSSTFHELFIVFSSKDLGDLCLSVLDAVPYRTASNKLFIYKLRMIGSITQWVLHHEKSCWEMIRHSVVESICFHLTNSQDETYLSIGILSNIIESIQTVALNNIEDFRPFYLLLDPLIHIIANLKIQHFAPSPQVLQMCAVDVLLDTFSLFYIIINSMDKDFLTQWTKSNLALCAELITICETSLMNSVYPPTWIVLRSWELIIIARILEGVASHAKLLHQSIIQSILHCCVAFDSHNGFQNPKKTQINFSELSTLPGLVRSIARNVWKSVDDCSQFAHYFCSHLLVPMFKLSELPENSELTPMQELATEMFHDLLVDEYSRTGEFSEINCLTVDTLDALAHESQQEAFVFLKRLEGALLIRLSAESEPLQVSVRNFLSQLSKLYELMNSLLRIPSTSCFEHERANVVIQLLEYLLSDSNAGRRKGMLYRYYTYLVDLNCSIEAFAEAGNTILRQLKLLEWSTRCTSTWEAGDASMSSPESEAKRKECLYLKAIEYFDRAELWESAITACEELRYYYQDITLDYPSLALILEKQAVFFRKIPSQSRFFPSYFRVVFFYQNGLRAEYVYRGHKLESIMDFAQRIRTKHFSARIVMSSEDPHPEVLLSNDLVITVTALCISSLSESQGVIDTVEDVPREIRCGRLHQNASWFMFCRAEKRLTQATPSTLKDLWVKKTFIRTEESFPNIRTRQLVVESVQRLVDPIDTACETIQRKNDELRETIGDFQRNRSKSSDLGKLTMQLNGIIDAAVNGGAKKYIEAFLISEIDEKGNSQNLLKQEMKTQIELLRSGLDIFKEEKKSDLEPLYNRLKELLEKMASSLNDIIT